jgi:hypothetical protein
MANKEISQLPTKTTPQSTDEIEVQESSGGDTWAVTLAILLGGVIQARGKVNSSGTLQTGSVGITSATKAATGTYDYTLSSAVTATGTAQMFATGETADAEVTATMTSTTVCRVVTKVGGTATDMANNILVFDEA